MSSFSNYLTILQSGIYRQKVKVELLRPSDESAYAELTNYLDSSSGSLNIEWQNGVRRTCEITINNTSDNPYYISPDSIFVNSKFKLWLGLEDDEGNIEWFSQGVFLMDNPQLKSQFSNSTLILRGIDKFGAFSTLRGELTDTYIIPIGTNISDAIQSLLTLMGDIQVPLIDISLLGEVTPFTITKERGSTIADLLLELVSINANNIYYNSDGVLVVEPDFEDNIKSSQWDFTTDEIQYQSSNLEYKWSEIYNSCLVVGANINSQIFSYKSENNNLLSPISIPNLGYERCYVHTSDVLDTTQKCQDLSEYILTRKTAIQSEITIDSIPMYHLNPTDIITITDTNLRLNEERYIINSISIPLKVGSVMLLSCVKEKELNLFS